MTESGTFLLLPADVPGRERDDACSEVVGLVGVVGSVGDDG